MKTVVVAALLTAAAIALPAAAVDPAPYVADGYRATVSTTQPAVGEAFVLAFDGDPNTTVVLTVEPTTDETGATSQGEGTETVVFRPVASTNDFAVRIDGEEAATATRQTDAAGHVEFEIEIGQAEPYELVLADSAGVVLYRQVVTVATSDDPAAVASPGVRGWVIAGIVVIAVLAAAGILLSWLRHRRTAVRR